MKRTTFKMMLFALIGMALSLTFVSCTNEDNDATTPGQDEPKDKAKYTIMFYGCGGGNLDDWLEDSYENILKALNASNGQVRFTVMFNTSKDATGYGSSVDVTNKFIADWATCYRFELTPQTDLTKAGFRAKYKYKDASEVPLYKTATLVEYINWAKQNAPAENYILMPMNHGGGTDLSEEVTRAIGYDTNHVNKETGYPYALGERSMVDALKQTNTHLKAIYWCGCMMGQLEVLTQLAPYCDYQFCSSHVSRAIESLLFDIINAINDEPDDFEKAALKDQKYKESDYNKYFVNVPDNKKPGEYHNENCDWGCWRSDKLADINAQVKKLATLLCENYNEPTKMPQIDYATAKTYVFEYDQHFADVLDFAVNVANELDEGQNATAKQIVADMESALNAAKVYRIDGVNIVAKNGVKIAPKKGFFSLGISIYSSTNKTWLKYGNNYKSTDFDMATGWSKFLDMNTVGVQNGMTNPANHSSYNLDFLDF